MYKIIVVDRSGQENKELVGDTDAFKAILSAGATSYLIDEQGWIVRSLASLVNGGKYTLGPKEEQPSQHGIDLELWTHQEREARRNLERTVQELQLQESRAVSYADYYAERRERIYTQWYPTTTATFIPSPLNNPSDPPHQGMESTVVKPFWAEILERQRLVDAYDNGYEVAYLGPKKPDIAFYPIGVARPGPHLFVAFGDCKGSSWTGTSSSELGQGMLYAHRILDAQPQRKYVHGFITNNHIAVLIMGYRETEKPFGVKWNISSPYQFEVGMKVFFNFLRTDNGFTAPPMIGPNSIFVKRNLPAGGTCRAFIAEYMGERVVAKLYETSARAAADAEKIRAAARVFLQHQPPPQQQQLSTGIHASYAKIPTVVATEGEWLLITPVGTPFSPISLKLGHLTKLLNTLQVIHHGQLIHNDVRFANCFLLEDDNVLLNDWGSSSTRGIPVPVQGCPVQLCHPELTTVRTMTPVPKYDLYSLVASTAKLLVPGLREDIRKAIFRDAFDAAEKEDYEGASDALRKIGVPP